MKRNLSLKSRIFRLFIIMIILSTSIVSVLGLTNSVNLITAQAEDRIMLEAQRNSNYFFNWFDTQKKLLTALSQEVEIRQLYEEKDDMQNYLAKRASAYPYILSIYMVTTKNEMIDSTFWVPDDDYDGLTRDWYIAAKDSDKVAMIAPYIDSQTKSTIITISKRIMHNGKIVGVMCIDITADNLAEMVKKSSENKKSYVFITDKDNNILMHPDPEFAPDGEGNMKNLKSFKGYDKLFLDDKETESAMCRFTSFNGEERFFKTLAIKDSDWRVIVSYSTKDIDKQLVTEIILIIGIMLAIFALAVMVINVFYKKHIAPIKNVCLVLDEMSNGNIHIDTNSLSAKSTEIYSLKTSMQNMANSLQNYVAEISSVLTKLSENDFTVNITGDYKGDFAPIKASLGQIIVSLNHTFKSIYEVSDNVKSSAQDVADGANSLSNGVAEQVNSIEEISTKLTNITQRVSDNAHKSKEASAASEVATSSIKESNEKMNDLLKAINDIHASSNEIQAIVKTIENISFQTNILALNASVEAARAGTAGKGFAVVAEEVRNLANKSAEAAKSIALLIQNSIGMVNNGVTLANLTATGLNE
ncbi:MAG: methyl-accepting chemotaxis protein, partial [Oscillospiraceae bacterium]